MGFSKLVYQDWVVAQESDPGRSWPETVQAGKSYNQDAIQAVTRALDGISEDEAAFIRRFYFQGFTYEEIGRETGRDTNRLILLHRRAVRSLIARLRPRCKHREAGDILSRSDCPLCRHSDRQGIERLLHTKRREETWKRIIAVLRETFGMPILTPQQIVGHLKYHHPPDKPADDRGPDSAANTA